MEEFEGIWDIQEMEAWEHRDLHETGIPHFEISKYGAGRFKFGYTMGVFDARLKTRGGIRLAFKWQGSDGDHEDGGIGEIRLIDKDTIEGELSFEYTHESTFIAKRRQIK